MKELIKYWQMYLEGRERGHREDLTYWLQGNRELGRPVVEEPTFENFMKWAMKGRS